MIFNFTIRLTFIAYIILIFVKNDNVNCIQQKNPLLLLISFDGFRWDYLTRHKLGNFEYLKSIGTHTEHVKNAFATVTFPNHWTLVTGLYEESHGIIENDMFDPLLNKTFNMNVESMTSEWYDPNKIVEPIWTLNQKAGNGRLSAAEWLGSNIVFDGVNVTSIDYNKSRSYNELIDQFIGLFTAEKNPINFGAIYFDEPDLVGHHHGPDSKEIGDKLAEIDSNLGYLIDKLKEKKLFDYLNIIITSDHGMESISQNVDQHVYLDKYVDINLFNVFGSSVVKSLFIKNKSDIEKVYKSLKIAPNLDVYLKDEFPDEYHYKNTNRFGDILLVAKKAYLIFDSKITGPIYKGSHGYYNNETSMYPIFIAQGPAIRKNYKIDSFNNVDIYPLMCAILDVTPGANNGSLSNVESMLTKFSKRHVILYTFISFTPILSAVVTAIVLYIINKRTNLPGQTLKDNDGYKMVSTSESNLLVVNDELADGIEND